MTAAPTPPLELEHCWCALPPAPEAVLEALAATERLAGRSLGPVEALGLEDRILDLPGGALRHRGLTLRLRRVDGRPRVTVKGPSSTGPDGAVQRREWEADWGPGVATRALAEVAALGGPALGGQAPGGPSADDPDVDPLERFAAVGLVTVQARRTRRRTRLVLDAGGRPLGELALDRVTFEFGPATVRHAEVELELLPGGDASALGEVAAALGRAEADRLQPWPFSKTALGALLERWAVDGRLLEGLDAAGRPTREGYRRLESELRV